MAPLLIHATWAEKGSFSSFMPKKLGRPKDRHRRRGGVETRY
jgi:hypothetical protein